MKQVSHGKKVTVHYTGKLDNGEVFDSSEDKEPLQFTIGDEKIIPALQKELLGMKPGDKKTTLIPAQEAYGLHQKEMVFRVERKVLPEDITPKLGQFLEIKHSGGEKGIAKVTDITDTHVTLDVNHPLAGKDLMFDLRVIEVD